MEPLGLAARVKCRKQRGGQLDTTDVDSPAGASESTRVDREKFYCQRRLKVHVGLSKRSRVRERERELHLIRVALLMAPGLPLKVFSPGFPK